MRNGSSYIAPIAFVLAAACNRTHGSHIPDADDGGDAK